MINFEDNPELNITPLVDIMLVLLVMLMVTTPIIGFEEKVDIPDGSKQYTIKVDNNSISISVISKDKIFINKVPTNFNNFADTFLNQSKALDKQTKIMLSIDGSFKYGDVVYVITLITKQGFNNISLVTK